MESIDVKCCLSNPVVHKNVNLESVCSASDLRALLSVYFEIEPYSFDMVYLGYCIRDDQMISEIGFRGQPIVYILNSTRGTHPQALVDLAVFNTAANTLKKILMSKAARNVLAKKLQNQKLLECIIKAVPEFGGDQIAISIITSRDLLWLFLSKDAPSRDKVLASHPSMAKAIMFLVEALKNESLDKSSTNTSKVETQDARAMYNIDHMSEDEDEEINDQFRRERTRRDHQRDLPSTFPRLFPQHPESNDSQPSTSAQSLITSDFFRQAMLMATGSNTPQGASAEINQEREATGAQDMDSKVGQLREMGIADEALARRILSETGGNLQLAIEILFGM